MHIEKFKCPQCDDGSVLSMNEAQDKFTCSNCEHELASEEATNLFEEGKLVAIIDGEEKDKKTMDEENEIRFDATEDVEALLKNETNLSEEFKEKAKTILEAAVNSQTKKIEEKKEAEIEERVETKANEMEEEIKNYLSYITDEWKEENGVALDSSIRNEMTENVVSDIKEVLSKYGIQLPEEKQDMVENLEKKVADLEAKLDNQIQENSKLHKDLQERVREDVVEEQITDLSDSQKEKIRSLIEGLSFKDDEQLKEKISTLRESYFDTGSNEEPEDVYTEDNEPEPKPENKNDDPFSTRFRDIMNRH